MLLSQTSGVCVSSQSEATVGYCAPFMQLKNHDQVKERLFHAVLVHLLPISAFW